jgi:hypothetical protein
VDVGLGEVVGPGSETVLLAGLGVVDEGSGTVDEEGAEVAVTALGDASEVSLGAAGELAGVRPR